MDKVGKEGVITVQDGKTFRDELEVVEGMKIDRGYLSHYFVTVPKTQKCEYDDPYILIYEKSISSIQPILPILEQVVQSGRPLLIIAEDVEGEALATLVVNKLRGQMKICAIKAPGFGDTRKATLQDIAILTGATFITEDIGLKLDGVKMDMLGRCSKIVVTKEDTIIMGGTGEKEAIQERVGLIKDMIKASQSDYEKEKLQERLAKLAGGVAVIKVGGASEVEVNEKKDRITDALNATKHAAAEGICGCDCNRRFLLWSPLVCFVCMMLCLIRCFAWWWCSIIVCFSSSGQSSRSETRKLRSGSWHSYCA